MKKIFAFLILLSFTTNIFSQEYSSEKFDEEYSEFKSLSDKYGKFNPIPFSEEVFNIFGVDDNGSIRLSYIINSTDSLYIPDAMSKCVNYFNYAFSTERSIQQYNEELRQITASGKYYKIAQKQIPALIYYKIVYIDASTDIILKFKENRIKIDVYVRHFNYISGDSFAQVNNITILPSKVYPCNKEKSQKDKDVYACAYINSISNSLDKVKSFIEYLNNNVKNVDDIEDW